MALGWRREISPAEAWCSTDGGDESGRQLDGGFAACTLLLSILSIINASQSSSPKTSQLALFPAFPVGDAS